MRAPRLKTHITLLLTALLLLAMPLSAIAEGSVTYDGSAKDFIFAPGSSDSPTDLFENFKGVMPGDSLTERLVIRSDAENKVKVKVYMRALGAREGSEDFLSKLTLTVDQADDSNLFLAPADQTAQLRDWVYLGTVYSGGDISLSVTLEVPPELDDAYQDAVGYLDWQFKVEELPAEPEDPQPPQTGDRSSAYLYIGLVGASALLLLLLLFLKRRKTLDKT